MGIIERIKEIEAEMARTQKDKATEYHLGQLKAKIAKLRTQLLEPPKSSSGAGEDFEVFRDKIMSVADVGSGGEEAVVTFDTITILTPSGRYNVELHLSFLRLQGQATDFKIQYSSFVRIFVLPKSNQPQTIVVTVDPPIRKGQTMYPHIVMQFETEYVVESTLVLNPDLYATKYKDKLEPSYKCLTHEVFTMILRGLSGTKTTRPSSVVVRMVTL